MSAKDEKQVITQGAEGQINPVSGQRVKLFVDGQEVQPIDADSLSVEVPAKETKPTDPQPGETKSKHFIRLFRGAFFGPNAMRNHSGLKLKKGKRK
ncbi:hypothetical protein ECML606-1_000118 [Escherichia phage ECML-606-1]|nr:hypothetical protein ECML606-1_000118 [Escherichia phage ECML-606-1]